MSGYKKFRPGQKVRTIYGEVRTVQSQAFDRVYVEEEPSNAWHHSDNLTLIETEDK